MKVAKFIVLFSVLFFGCTKEVTTINTDKWNKQIISKLRETDSLILEQKESLENVNFLLNFRKKIIAELNKLNSDENFSKVIIYENYNCEYLLKDKFKTDFPNNKNKFYFSMMVIPFDKDYFYEGKGFSENATFLFKKDRFENKEEHSHFLEPENIGVKKVRYLLNDFSIASKISFKNNEIEIISTRLN